MVTAKIHTIKDIAKEARARAEKRGKKMTVQESLDEIACKNEFYDWNAMHSAIKSGETIMINPDPSAYGPILDMTFPTQCGFPCPHWVITDSKVTDGWWGEGYIIHTVSPAFIFRWGFAHPSEAGAMGCGFSLNEDTSLAIMGGEPIGKKKSSIDDMHSVRMSAMAPLLEFLTRKLDGE